MGGGGIQQALMMANQAAKTGHLVLELSQTQR